MKKQYYVQEQDLIDELNLWRDSAQEVEDRVASNRFVEMIYTIADHLLTHKRFMRYPYHEKEEMKQDAVLKCLHNLKNIDTSKGTVFNYFTRTCWTAFITYLAKYYKDMNKKRQMLLVAMQNLGDQKDTIASAYLQQLMNDIQRTIDLYGDRKSGNDTQEEEE